MRWFKKKNGNYHNGNGFWSPGLCAQIAVHMNCVVCLPAMQTISSLYLSMHNLTKYMCPLFHCVWINRNHWCSTDMSVPSRKSNTTVKVIWFSVAARIRSQMSGFQWTVNVWVHSMGIRVRFGASTPTGHQRRWSPAPVTCPPSK